MSVVYRAQSRWRHGWKASMGAGHLAAASRPAAAGKLGRPARLDPRPWRPGRPPPNGRSACPGHDCFNLTCLKWERGMNH